MDNLSVSTARQSRLRTVHPRANRGASTEPGLVWAACAGKGTQTDRIAQRHNVPKISTGDMLRKAIQDRSRIGTLVRDTLQSGALVGDDLMISIVGERLEHPDTARGFVLDGFPRTIPQASALDALLADRGRVTVIALVVHGDEVIRRLSGRGRQDDERS